MPTGDGVALDEYRVPGDALSVGGAGHVAWLLETTAASEAARSFAVLVKFLARNTAQACQVDRGSIFLWRRGRLVPVAAEFADRFRQPEWQEVFERVRERRLERIPAFMRALRDRTPILVVDPRRSSLVPRYWIETFESRSLLALPLFRGDRIVGVLQLDNSVTGAPITQRQLAFANALTGQLALTIDDARLVAQTRRRFHRTRTLLRVTGVVTSTLDLREVARLITREVARLLGADSAGIYSQDRMLLRPLAAYHLPKELLESMRNQPIALEEMHALKRVMEEARQSVWTDDVPNHPAFRDEIFQRFRAQSILLTPLRVGDELFGMLVCAWWNRRRRLSRAELSLVEAIAAQAAIAIANARLYAVAEEAAVKRERMRLDQILHDTLSQTVFSIALKLDHCLRDLRCSPDFRDTLKELKEAAGVVMTQMRQLLPAEPPPELSSSN
jgi:GAF domain-containing protein